MGDSNDHRFTGRSSYEDKECGSLASPDGKLESNSQNENNDDQKVPLTYSLSNIRMIDQAPNVPPQHQPVTNSDRFVAS